MGSSVIIDILGSSIIAAFLLLMVLNLHGTVAQATFTTGNDLTVQENLVSMIDLVEHDFRRLGWCADPVKIPDPTESILQADEHSIRILTDVDADGNVDTLIYLFIPGVEVTSSSNPRDRVLFRIVNRQPPLQLDMGVTQFGFAYINSLGDTLSSPVAQPKDIHSMELSITLESPSAYDTTYAYAHWKQLRLTSRNLKNR